MNTFLPVHPLALSHTIPAAGTTPELQGLWDGPAWSSAPVLDIKHFHSNSRSRHSRVQAKLLYDADHVYVHFRVEDQYVQSMYTNYQDGVCRDSCVEFFVQPKAGHGYFNFEINCGGAMLLYYIIDPKRKPEGGFTAMEPVPFAQGSKVRIFHSMPVATPTVISTPVTWQIEAAIPLSLMSAFVGEIAIEPGTQWRGNLYKCGGARPYAHWASWSAIEGTLNFHKPEFFGVLEFA